MIKILKKCEDIAYLLENLKPVVKDFRVCLRKNENLYVNVVLTEDRYDELSVAVHQIYNEAELECLTEEQLEDPFYKSIFAQKGPVILDSGHRRNGSLKIRKPQSDTTERPVVVSFYSYKGGMGRTTAMAAFAMYLSSVYAKRVAVIDCDYEAPGLNNFFLKYPGELNNHNGLVEYLLDMSCGLLDTNTVTDYLQEVDHVFSGEGSIFVMTAGNMGVDRITSESSDTHLDHYLEGISRMDISNTRYAVELFEALVGDINNALHPDIILIDSKTGINDVMGLAVCSLADIVVGFFRNDAQTLPGLQFFIKTMMDNSRVEPFLVNSILPSARSQRRTLFGQFTKDVDSIINAVDNDSNICFPCYPIGRQPDFEVLGSVAETVNDFAEAVRNGDFREYVELFEDLIKSIRKHGEILSDDNSQTKDALRESILLDTSETLSGIDLYAENQSILNDISNRHFYYRRCMNDLLNHDKYLVIGSKGTGKSYIYNALKQPQAVELIKRNAGKSENYHFVYAIDRSINRIFDVAKIGKLETAEKYKFWLIYTWNIVIGDIKKEFPGYDLSGTLRTINISDTITAREQLLELLADDEYSKQIEAELMNIDEYLLSLNVPSYLDIIYDQLDDMVAPLEWNNWIPELIRYWRVKRFSRIGAKIFIRRDLFKGLVGLTNINDIENQAIDIEWRKEEIYSYFFYVLLKEDVADKFWRLMDLYGEYSPEMIAGFRKDFTERAVPIYETKMLEAMMSTFFGDTVDMEGTTRMGRSYDWFYKNLKNADDTISLRPFISLLQLAIKKQITDGITSDGRSYPVLYQNCYTNSSVRKEAVEGYLNDLIRNAKGNMPIQYVFDFISTTEKTRYHRISMRRQVFEDLLTEVIRANAEKEEMASMTVEQLTTILVDNGIVAKNNRGNGDFYAFSFIYKYRLALHGS